MSAVRLPFFSDDVLHFRYATQVPTLHIWTKADITYIYYRPIINFILHMALVYLGVPLSAPMWHMVILWNHMLNTALVGALAREMRLNRTGQIVAMLIFAAFPFSAQAVTWILAWFHPLAATAILLVCMCGLRYIRQPRRKGMLAIAIVAGIIAPFIHENGFLCAPMLVMLAALRFYPPSLTLPPYTEEGRKTRRMSFFKSLSVYWEGFREGKKHLLPVLQFLIPMGLAVIGYFAARSQVFPPGGTPPQMGLWIDQNIAALVQGISFPFQFLTGQITSEERIPLAWLGFGLFAIILLVALWLLRRRFDLIPIVLAGGGWWLLASFPAAYALTPIYVILGERLFYVAAPGVALIYGTVIGSGLSAKNRISRLIAMTALLLTIGLSAIFIRDHRALYNRLTAGYADLFAQIEDVPTLLINAPMQLDAYAYTLPLTRQHAFVMHDYLKMPDFLWLNTGQEYPQVSAAQFGETHDVLDGYAPHYYGTVVDGAGLTAMIQQVEQVILFDLSPEGVYQARLVGERTDATGDFVVDFAGIVRLESINMERTNDVLHVGLQWRKLTAEPFPYITFVHLLCDDVMVDQSDGAPLDNLYGFTAWSVDETWRDYVDLRMNDAAPDCLSLRIGLYRRDDGTRALLTNVQGEPLDEEWLTIPVEN